MNKMVNYFPPFFSAFYIKIKTNLTKCTANSLKWFFVTQLKLCQDINRR